MDEFSEAHLIQNVTQPQEGDDRIPIQKHDLQMRASLVSTIAFIGREPLKTPHLKPIHRT
jgi:hypothetical protein